MSLTNTHHVFHSQIGDLTRPFTPALLNCQVQLHSPVVGPENWVISRLAGFKRANGEVLRY